MCAESTARAHECTPTPLTWTVLPMIDRLQGGTVMVAVLVRPGILTCFSMRPRRVLSVAQRGRGFGPVAVTSRWGTHSST
jgi:hypothetical protein